MSSKKMTIVRKLLTRVQMSRKTSVHFLSVDDNIDSSKIICSRNKRAHLDNNSIIPKKCSL